jgi:hypothetical protein
MIVLLGLLWPRTWIEYPAEAVKFQDKKSSSRTPYRSVLGKGEWQREMLPMIDAEGRASGCEKQLIAA